MIKNIKLLLGITDNLQDDLLTLLIANAKAYVRNYFNTEIYEQDENSFIIEEVVVKRFRRLGSEGYKSDSTNGRSITFSENDFAPYAYLLHKEKGLYEKGTVTFY